MVHRWLMGGNNRPIRSRSIDERYYYLWQNRLKSLPSVKAHQEEGLKTTTKERTATSTPIAKPLIDHFDVQGEFGPKTKVVRMGLWVIQYCRGIRRVKQRLRRTSCGTRYGNSGLEETQLSSWIKMYGVFGVQKDHCTLQIHLHLLSIEAI